MRIYIDTCTFPASPALYADAEKAKPLPRIIPLVQGFRGEIEVCFLGELAPKPGDGLTLAMRPYGTGADVVRAETVAVVAGAEAGVVASAKVSLAVNTDALQAAIGTRETLNVLCGVIVTDDAAAFPTRMEWQIVFAVAASALPNGVPAPEISPSAVDMLRGEINAVKTDLAKNYVNRNSSQDVAGVKSFLQGINIGSSANPFGVPDWRIASGGITYFGGGMSMPGNTKILPQGVSSDVVSARAVKGLTSSAGEILIPAKAGTFALISDVESAVGKALTSAYKYAGQVPTEADLPESAENGDVYDVADTGKNYAYDAKLGRWDALGGTINYATAAELQALQSAVEAKASDADVVHKAGDETITGVKKFDKGGIVLGNGTYISDNVLPTKIIEKNNNGDIYLRGDVAELTGSLSVLRLEGLTPLGAPAYGLHVSAKGGLQLFGTHFFQGTLWDDIPSALMPGLKVVANNISLYSTDEAAIGFDYANKVIFRTMPNDGTEATYEFQAWQWDDDSHSSKSPSAGVKFLKQSQKTALVPNSVLNMAEGDARWWRDGSSSISIKPDGQSSPATIFLSTYYSGESFRLSFAGLEKDGGRYPDVDFDLPFTGGQIALKSDIPSTSGFVQNTAYATTPVRFGLEAGGELAMFWADRFLPLTSIATTRDVSEVDKKVVHLSGDETITGIKTFSNGTVSGAIKFDEYGISIDFDNFGDIALGSSRGAPCFRVYGKEVLVPTSKSGALALLDDIPDTSNFLSSVLSTPVGDSTISTYFESKGRDVGFSVHSAANGSLGTFIFPKISGGSTIHTLATNRDISAIDLTKGGTINGGLTIVNDESSPDAGVVDCDHLIAKSISIPATLESLTNDSVPNVGYLNDNFSLKTNTILGSGASGNSDVNNSGVAIGGNAKATGGANGAEPTAVGARASATGPCSTALGRDAIASTCMTIALGAGANATGMQAIALGAGAHATKTDSIAIGHNVENFLSCCALVGVPDSDLGTKCLSIGVINDDNPGFLFLEQDNVLGTTLTGVRISKENFMAMLKQFGGEDFTATKPAEA